MKRGLRKSNKKYFFFRVSSKSKGYFVKLTCQSKAGAPHRRDSSQMWRPPRGTCSSSLPLPGFWRHSFWTHSRLHLKVQDTIILTTLIFKYTLMRLTVRMVFFLNIKLTWIKHVRTPIIERCYPRLKTMRLPLADFLHAFSSYPQYTDTTCRVTHHHHWFASALISRPI